MTSRRRDFVRGAAAAAASTFFIVPRHVVAGSGQVAPSDKVTIGCIGLGRQGMYVMMNLLAKPEVRVVSVCDVNAGSLDYVEYSDNSLMQQARKLLGPGNEKWGTDLESPGSVYLTPNFKTSLGMGGRGPAQRLVNAYYKGTGCTAYRDFRELLEKEKSLDAVYVATPDHWHAPIGLAAMRKGKHVLGQKPMTHSVGEARRMAATARDKRVATSVTVNNPYTHATLTIKKWIEDGAIGRVRAVHNWSSRPFWPQGELRPTEAMAAPAGLDWDMWVGPAAERPYHKAYLPFVWRGWFDFGCGSYGDMGCYSFAGIFKILGLDPPVAVESSASEPVEDMYPKASIVHMDFAAKGSRGPVRLTWYDGGLMPPRPAGLGPSEQRLFARRGEGIIYEGDKGIIVAGFNGQNPKVYPENPAYVYQPPASRTQEDLAIDIWLKACKGAPTGEADFPTQCAPTESFLLGCLAQRMPNERFEWDSASMKIRNSEAAQKRIDPPWRGGDWTS